VNYQRLYAYRFKDVDQDARGAVWNALAPFFFERMGKPERVLDPNVREAEQQLQRSLGLRVQIQDKHGKGKIVLEYKSLEDFDRVLEILSSPK